MAKTGASGRPIRAAPRRRQDTTASKTQDHTAVRPNGRGHRRTPASLAPVATTVAAGAAPSARTVRTAPVRPLALGAFTNTPRLLLGPVLTRAQTRRARARPLQVRKPRRARPVRRTAPALTTALPETEAAPERRRQLPEIGPGGPPFLGMIDALLPR